LAAACRSPRSRRPCDPRHDPQDPHDPRTRPLAAGIPLTARPKGAPPSPATSASCMSGRPSSQQSCHLSAAPFWVFVETVFVVRVVVFDAEVRCVVCLPYLLPRAFDSIKHLSSSSVCTAPASRPSLWSMKDPGPLARTGLLYPPEVETLPTSSYRFRWYSCHSQGGWTIAPSLYSYTYSPQVSCCARHAVLRGVCRAVD
jgi:hypothetical protein